MNLELEIINPLQHRGWNDLLISAPGYSFFHSESWARVLYESYRYNPLYFTLVDKDKLLALIPVMEIKSILTGRRGVSLPFSDYCEPIIAQNIQFQDMMNYVIGYGKKAGWKSLELRGGKSFQPGSIPCYYYYSHSLDIEQKEEQIFANFRNNTQRNIRKAVREDVDVKICNSLDSIREYYRLHCMTRKGKGLPPQPYNFFRKIYDHIISKNMGFVFLATYNNRNIAGAVYFHFGEKAIYKFGASNRTYQHLRANNLVMWEAIKWYSQNGYKNLCFGRTEPENNGLRQFKIGWGTKEQIINYLKYDLRTDAYVQENQHIKPLHNKIFKMMPMLSLKIIGSLLYKHMG